MEVSGQLHASSALLQGRSRWYPLDRRLSEPQNRSERGGEKKNYQPLPRLETPLIQRYTTELSRLLIQWIPGVISLGVKRVGCEADYSLPSNAEVKNPWSYTSTPKYVCMEWCLSNQWISLHRVALYVVKHWGNLGPG
jgi:hypothetical protein